LGDFASDKDSLVKKLVIEYTNRMSKRYKGVK